MYVAKEKYGIQAYFGKTLAEAYDKLSEEEGTGIEDTVFYKADAIKVELQEVTVVKKVPVVTKQAAKKPTTNK